MDLGPELVKVEAAAEFGALFFTFIGQVMPPYVSQKILQRFQVAFGEKSALPQMFQYVKSVIGRAAESARPVRRVRRVSAGWIVVAVGRCVPQKRDALYVFVRELFAEIVDEAPVVVVPV